MQAHRPLSRAFSLVEMLVVLLILAVVMAIILPMLAAGRTAARKAATQSMLGSVSAASNAFILDERRAPGYFSMADMAASNNDGFTMMDNLVLDLAGGITQGTINTGNGNMCDVVNGPQVVRVGPDPAAASSPKVNLQNIGSSNKSATGVTQKGYLQLDPKFFTRQCTANTKRVASGSNNPNLAFPSLVDSFGQPVLAWAQDDTPAPDAAFAAQDYGDRAKFYWVTNRAFLGATALGKQEADQRYSAEAGSLIGTNSAGSNWGNANVAETLEAILGNPADPSVADSTMPASARGKLVFHSAGANGVFLGKKERGGRSAAGGPLQYSAGTDHATNGSFDDIFQTVQ